MMQRTYYVAVSLILFRPKDFFIVNGQSKDIDAQNFDVFRD
jgi:hypothetical protein